MTRMMLVLAAAGLIGAGSAALAQEALAQEVPAQGAPAQEAPAAGGRGNPEFLGIDLDNGSVYYNGRDSGRYCLYRTEDVFNRATGYVEARRVRRCGRGLYLR